MILLYSSLIKNTPAPRVSYFSGEPRRQPEPGTHKESATMMMILFLIP